MATGNEPHSTTSLEERRFEEERRKARRDEQIRIAELRQRRVESQRSRGSLRELLSPLGVAAVAGLVGIVGTLVSGAQNRAIEAEKNTSIAQLEREKQTATEKLERQKAEAALILKIAEQPDPKQRALNLLFFSEGGYLTLPSEYTTYLRGIAELKEGEAIPAPSLTSYVPAPEKRTTTLTRASQETMIELLGVPGEATGSCSPPTNDRLQRLLTTENVGPFNVGLIRPAVDAVKLVMEDVRAQNAELYAALGSAGGLCMRLVRPPSKRYSNHSWGTALDIKINGELSRFGRDEVLYGVVLLAPFFEKQGFIWDSSDGMHFEASEQLLRQWSRDGKLD